ncbi:ABC transporter substrate-binding protein [Agromyces neolithicus]|uniref:ABC transporter substrate-binding protein n=1 Tax=Agromyces neolithicus TaxID=269420 RepID=A0ABP4YLI4_9MICO
MAFITKPARVILAATATAAVIALSACTSPSSGAGDGDVVEGGTFTLAIVSDPGTLDPQASAVTSLFQLTQFAYDTLVSVDEEGTIGSQLATEWEVDGTTATFTLTEGVTCSDGSEFTAKTAAENIAWISDPENQSPFLGAFLPGGVTAAAEGDTLTLTLASPAPFLLTGLASVPMVCEAGLADRSDLAAGTIGSGPYELTEAVPNDHYTYTVRGDYTWGPDGATTAEKGVPAVVNVRIIPNETTAANLLLSGEISAATVIGPDTERLDQAGLFATKITTIVGEQWYNHNEGHPTSDPAVRMALTQALDLAELQKVATSGKGEPATALAVSPPAGCTFDSVTGNVPETDVDAAKAALDTAGWLAGSDGVRAKDGQKLSLTFLYSTNLGSGGTAAAELAITQWQAIGAEVTAQGQDESTLTGALFGTGAWDIGWVPLNVNTPDQVIGFISGPSAPEGTNFSNIQNDDYAALMEEAMAMNGSDGCPTWAEAEAALFSAADLVPFANNLVKTYAKGAEFENIGSIVPTSIRMVS